MKKMEDEKLEQAAGGTYPEEGWTRTYYSALASECPYFYEKPDKRGNCKCECGSCIYFYDPWCKKGQVL